MSGRLAPDISQGYRHSGGSGQYDKGTSLSQDRRNIGLRAHVLGCFGLGEPAVVVGARSLRVGRPTDYFRCALPSPTHPPAVRHASLIGSQVAEASGGGGDYVMCSR